MPIGNAPSPSPNPSGDASPQPSPGTAPQDGPPGSTIDDLVPIGVVILFAAGVGGAVLYRRRPTGA